MSYYFQRAGRKRTKQLEEECYNTLEKVKGEIETSLGSTLQTVWTSIDTFALVFTDNDDYKNKKKIVGKGAKQLFGIIKNDYDFIVLSNSGDNWRPVTLMDKKRVMVINTGLFKRFLEIFSNNESKIKLFLCELNDDTKLVINNWWLGLEKKLGTKIKDESTNIHALEDSNLPSLSSEIVKQDKQQRIFNLLFLEQMKQKLSKYYKILSDFEKDVKDETKKEPYLNKILIENPWIIDIIYEFSPKPKPQETISKTVDIQIVDNLFGIDKHILVECKRPDDSTVPHRKGVRRPKSNVIGAVSQCITEMEKFRDKKIRTTGIVIAGRSSDNDIEIFNNYIHNIKIISYEELIERARARLDFFGAKLPNSQSNKDNIPQKEIQESTEHKIDILPETSIS
ncbi:MAG: Shedu anti-phage system protein SduA domain-containing protein [Candidatus Aenigmatarchaeota archaeon]